MARQFLCTVFILLTLSQSISSQLEEKHLILQESSKRYSDLDDEESLEQETKTAYAYDLDLNIYKKTVCTFNITDNMGCQKQFTTYHTYDSDRRLIREESESYGYPDEGITVWSSIQYEYLGDFLLKKIIKSEYFLENRIINEVESFDPSGRWYFRKYSGKSDGGDSFDYQFRAEFNDAGYLVLGIDSLVNVVDGVRSIELQKLELSYLYDSLLTEQNRYRLDDETGTFILVEQSRMEYELDTYGNVTRLTTYGNLQPGDTTLLLLRDVRILFDEFHRDTLRIGIDEYRTRSRVRKSYDDRDNLLKKVIEIWNGNTESWELDGFEMYEYDNHNNLTSQESRFFYQKATSNFISNRILTIEYNEYNQEVYRRELYHGDGNLNIIYEDIEITSEYACDGRLEEKITRDLTTNEGSVLTNSYLDLPSCEIKNPITLSAKLFPNPAEGLMYLQFDEDVMTQDLHIFDMSGKYWKVQSNSYKNLQILDISSLHPGSYILRLEANDQVILKKFVKI